MRAIHVHDGQSVKAGEVLIELDPTMTEAEQRRPQGDLIAAELDIARLQAALEPGDPFEDFHPRRTRRQIWSPWNAIPHRADRRASCQAPGARSAARRKAGGARYRQATVDKLEAYCRSEAACRYLETLYNHSTGSKANYLEFLQTYVEQQHELEVQKSKSREAQETLAAITESRAQTEAEYRRTRFSELDDAERKAPTSRGSRQGEARADLQRLTAPVDGTVQQVAVHTIGGVVTPAQTCSRSCRPTARSDRGHVQNRDIGFVEVGRTRRSRSTPLISRATACYTARY